VDEITEYLGVSRDTIYNWIATRAMPAHRVGRLWKFKREAVDAWVQSGGADSDASASDGGDEQASADARAPGTRKTRGKPRGGAGE